MAAEACLLEIFCNNKNSHDKVCEALLQLIR